MRRVVRDETALGGWSQPLALALGLALPAWILRLLVLQEVGGGQISAVARGFMADLLATLCCLLAVLWVAAWKRGLAVVLALLWTLLQYANYEHVRALDALLSFTYAGFLKDPVFLFGSGSALARPLVLLALLCLTGGLTWWLLKGLDRRRSSMTVTLLIVVTGVILWRSPAGPQEPRWMQTHFLAREIWRVVPQGSAVAGLDKPDPKLIKTIAESWDPDLSGMPWTNLDRIGYNVLMVVLEGVSGAYLPTVTAGLDIDSEIEMTRLDRIAATHPVAVRFIAQQRQTNRGLYALLCGRSPKLDASSPHLNRYALGPESPCLAEVLAARGYQTMFFQASPLSFMLKGQTMPHVGFEAVIGERGDELAYARSAWGIDDRAFLGSAVEMVKRLDQNGEPWFLTLLTVGTHHPYTVPDKAQSSTDMNLERAMRYLDRAIGEFIDRLTGSGLLENTLVILTSDESAGLSSRVQGLRRPLSQNWSVAILMFPGAESKRIEEKFLQSDLALSILDFLGEHDQVSPFTGRSLFRSYRSDRSLFFANTHLGRVYGFFPPSDLVGCLEGLAECQQFALGHDLFSESAEIDSPSPRHMARLAAAIAAAREGGDPSPDRNRYPLLDDLEVEVLTPHRKIFDGQYLDVLETQVVEVEIAGEVVGERGWVHLRHELVSAGETHFRSQWPVLGPGDKFRVHYHLTPEEAITGLICRTFADLIGTDRLDLRFEVAELRIVPKEEGGQHSKVEVVEESVERREEPRTVSLELDTADWVLAPCATIVEENEILADRCPPGQVVVEGPRIYVPAGARIDVVHRLAGMEGATRIRSRIESEVPPIPLAESPVVDLAAGQSVDLPLSFEMNYVLDELVVRIVLEDETSSDVAIRIRETRVTMDLP